MRALDSLRRGGPLGRYPALLGLLALLCGYAAGGPDVGVGAGVVAFFAAKTSESLADTLGGTHSDR